MGQDFFLLQSLLILFKWLSTNIGTDISLSVFNVSNMCWYLKQYQAAGVTRWFTVKVHESVWQVLSELT